MSCLDPVYDRYLARIEAYEGLLEAAYALQLSLLESKMRKYSLDTKEAEQRSELQKLTEVRESITFYESELDRLSRKVRGCGVIGVNLRRKFGSKHTTGCC